MKHFRRQLHWLSALSAAVLLTGCAGFGDDPVTSELDPHAEVCLVCDNDAGFSVWQAALTQLRGEFDAQKPSEAALLRKLDELQKLMSASGLTACRRWSASSKKIADQKFRNQMVLEPAADADGWLWQAFGKGNRPLRTYFDALPDNTAYAVGAALDLRILAADAKLLKEVAKLDIGEVLRTAFGASTPELLLDNCSGVWVFSVQNPQPEQFAFELSFPDPDGCCFATLKAAVKPGIADKLNDDEIVFNFPADSGRRLSLVSRPGVDGREHRLCLICRDAEVPMAIGTLAEQDEFKTWCAGLPEDGVLMAWSSADSAVPINFFGKKLALKAMNYAEATVIRQLPSGHLQLIENSAHDIATGFSFDLMLSAIDLISTDLNLDQLSADDRASSLTSDALEPDAPEDDEDADEDTLPEPLHISIDCMVNLQKINDFLQAYAAAHDSEMPAEPGLDGWKELISYSPLAAKWLICPDSGCETWTENREFGLGNAGYVYFGAWPKEASLHLPLAVDRPENHSDSFYLLYRNGKVELIRMAMPGNLRRMMEELHRRWQYAPEEWQELLTRTEKLNRVWELELDK